ncbi:MAG: glycosyltransferase family 4 protein [Acidobacteriota bacterium]
MRIGLIAPELPPDLGGMAELSRGLTLALAATTEVVLVTLPDHGLPGADIPQYPILKGWLPRDQKQLNALATRHRIDAWLALNAGLAPLARHLDKPCCSFFMGNDFLNPWIPYGAGWMERFQRPYLRPLRTHLRRAAVRRAVSDLRGLFSISRSTSRLVSQHLDVAPDRIELHPPGVDDAFFQAGTAGEHSTLRMLTVARLSRYNPRKNVDGVLRALAQISPDIRWRYTVVGGGDDLPRLRELTEQLGIADRVVFLGAIGRDELLSCYRRADLFVLAARASGKDVEGFGIVYIEAAASGVPALASRAGGATDAVIDGETGVVIHSSTAEAIARGIERFAQARHRFAPDTVRAFAERFRWAKIAAGVRHSLQGKLAGRSAAAAHPAERASERVA